MAWRSAHYHDAMAMISHAEWLDRFGDIPSFPAESPLPPLSYKVTVERRVVERRLAERRTPKVSFLRGALPLHWHVRDTGVKIARRLSRLSPR